MPSQSALDALDNGEEEPEEEYELELDMDSSSSDSSEGFSIVNVSSVHIGADQRSIDQFSMRSNESMCSAIMLTTNEYTLKTFQERKNMFDITETRSRPRRKQQPGNS